VALLEHHLRRRVSERSSHGVEHLLPGVEHLGDSEIRENERRVRIGREIEEVLGLQIYDCHWRSANCADSHTRASITRTSMDDVVVVQVADGIEYLADNLGGILLGKFSVFTDTIKQLSSGSKLGNDVVFVLPNPRTQQ
jgi:hypothetical protein